MSATLTAHTAVVAKDVPEWLTRAFDLVDFDRIPGFIASVTVTQLRKFCAAYPQKRTASYSAEYRETLTPQHIIDIVSVIDYAAIAPAELERMKHDVPNYLKTYLSPYLRSR